MTPHSPHSIHKEVVLEEHLVAQLVRRLRVADSGGVRPGKRFGGVPLGEMA